MMEKKKEKKCGKSSQAEWNEIFSKGVLMYCNFVPEFHIYINTAIRIIKLAEYHKKKLLGIKNPPSEIILLQCFKSTENCCKINDQQKVQSIYSGHT